jgi:hypothetical protein
MSEISVNHEIYRNGFADNSLQMNGNNESLDTFLFSSESVGEGHPGRH